MLNRALVIGPDPDNPIEPFVEPIGNIQTFFLRMLVSYYTISPWEYSPDVVKVKILPADNPTVMKNKTTTEIISYALSTYGATVVAQDILYPDFSKG